MEQNDKIDLQLRIERDGERKKLRSESSTKAKRAWRMRRDLLPAKSRLMTDRAASNTSSLANSSSHVSYSPASSSSSSSSSPVVCGEEARA